MSEPQFFQTRMGQRFYERDVPEFVAQLKRLNDTLERIAQRPSERTNRDDNVTS